MQTGFTIRREVPVNFTAHLCFSADYTVVIGQKCVNEVRGQQILQFPFKTLIVGVQPLERLFQRFRVEIAGARHYRPKPEYVLVFKNTCIKIPYSLYSLNSSLVVVEETYETITRSTIRQKICACEALEADKFAVYPPRSTLILVASSDDGKPVCEQFGAGLFPFEARRQLKKGHVCCALYQNGPRAEIPTE